jgi:hypothetical protein
VYELAVPNKSDYNAYADVKVRAPAGARGSRIVHCMMATCCLVRPRSVMKLDATLLCPRRAPAAFALQYKVDNSAKFTDGSFKRIAYHIQLDTEWVWASMNAFTTEADKIGLPVDWNFNDASVTGLTILSNAAKLTSYNGMTQGIGDIEFWSACCCGGAGLCALQRDVDHYPTGRLSC